MIADLNVESLEHIATAWTGNGIRKREGLPARKPHQVPAGFEADGQPLRHQVVDQDFFHGRTMIGHRHRHFHLLVRHSPLDTQLPGCLQRGLIRRLQISDQQITHQRQGQRDELSLQKDDPCKEQRVREKTEKK